MATSTTNPQDGPSKWSRKSKTKKRVQKPVKRSKELKISKLQKLDALEHDAMNYVPPEDLKLFSDLPISELTKRGLKKAFFVNMTDIQIKSIPTSLKGKDVLAAAPTGSGKTLAFLIPVLEILYRRKWSQADGLGALIISPTRELAVQIFEVLRSIGGLHSFSAGLVIGGKNLKDESDRLSRMNILVATPGRLLQHMDQTVGFVADNLQTLILDEADRILDMGFSRTLSALLSHLPKTRQTLLFSATQTQSVTALARLSLNNPVSIGLDDTSHSTTPQNLEQHYILCSLDKKLDMLWSFIKTHLQAKILVFLSSGKQVRFVFETFCKMHPGMPLLQLHGKQKQMARLNMYDRFTSFSHAVLFATDIAARGLDFPAVDWVVQVDAPEDVDTYIHRVGRTARYESKGRALLFLMPSEEEGMKRALQTKNIDIQMIKIRSSKTLSIENHLQNLAFKDPEIKYLGQRAFVSYLRSIHLHKDKSIFKLEELPTQLFAESLGLPGAPKIKFLNKKIANAKKNTSRTVEAARMEALEEREEDERSKEGEEGTDTSNADDDDNEEPKAAQTAAPTRPSKPLKVNTVRTKYDRMFERKNQNILSEHYSKLISHKDDSDDPSSDEDFITLKRMDHGLSDYEDEKERRDEDEERENLSKRKLKLSRAKRAIAKNGKSKKLVFDDEGNAHELYELGDADEWYESRGGLLGAKEEGKKFVEGEKTKMEVTNLVDRDEAREKKREKKRKRKEREREEGEKTMDNGGKEGSAVLPMLDVDDGYVSPEFDLRNPSEDGEDVEDIPPPSKRSRISVSRPGGKERVEENTLEDDEELALQLLRRKR